MKYENKLRIFFFFSLLKMTEISFEKGALNLLLAPGARNPRYATGKIVFVTPVPTVKTDIMYIIVKFIHSQVAKYERSDALWS